MAPLYYYALNQIQIFEKELKIYYIIMKRSMCIINYLQQMLTINKKRFYDLKNSSRTN